MHVQLLTLLQSGPQAATSGAQQQQETIRPSVPQDEWQHLRLLAQQDALRALLQSGGTFPSQDDRKPVLNDRAPPSPGPRVLFPAPSDPLIPPTAPVPGHFELTPDFLAAIARALGQPLASSSQPPLPSRKYFSQTITNATSDLPLAVIKELKAGFKNYIPLALCTHKACQTATRTTDAFDTEIGWTEKGEMRLKTKSMTAAKDHYITTDDFTELRENFVRGMRRYLVMGDDEGPGGERASACADMFREFFSVIAARPDYTQDWPSYRGYLIETYTSWVGRRDDSYGLIFDEPLFFKYKMANLLPLFMEQVRQPLAAIGTPLAARGGAGG
jgi:hypothetical protein